MTTTAAGAGILIGYARCSTDEQDLTAQRGIRLQFGVAQDRIYLDHGLTRTHRARPPFLRCVNRDASWWQYVMPGRSRRPGLARAGGGLGGAGGSV